jgi:hypothetical protein
MLISSAPVLSIAPLGRDVYCTGDPDLAAFLYAHAFPLLEVASVGDGPTFVFGCEAASAAEAFYSGASTCAKRLLFAARQLSSLEGAKLLVNNASRN